MYHLGRRQPFQMYILAGGGIVRRDELREDFIYETADPGKAISQGPSVPGNRSATK